MCKFRTCSQSVVCGQGIQAVITLSLFCHQQGDIIRDHAKYKRSMRDNLETQTCNVKMGETQNRE